MENSLAQLNKALIEKYDVAGSYYAVYPPVGLWSENFSSLDYVEVLKNLESVKEGYPLSLYVHFPFCAFQCYYCNCFSLVTRDNKRIQEFLSYLFLEIDLIKDIFKKYSVEVNIKEIHLGGGSPSIIERKEFDQLIDKLQSLVNIEDLAEFSLEIDPRTVNQEKMEYYRDKGISRISFGVQDFDPRVQKAINRLQPFELVKKLSKPEIRNLFKGLNLDLIYGLPLQTRESFRKTIELTKEISPDRLSVYTMGYRPDIIKHNRLIKESEIPAPFEKTMMWKDALSNLVENGYERIGLDHFAKSTDDLAKAMRNKTMHRNGIGFTPGRCHDNIGIGPSALSVIGKYKFQNTYSLKDYYAAVSSKKFSIIRGYKLNNDDLIRREIMFNILSYYSLCFQDIEAKYNIRFKAYFEKELTSDLLKELVKDGLVEILDNRIDATPLGKFFLRNLCYVFDNLEEGYKHSREYTT